MYKMVDIYNTEKIAQRIRKTREEMGFSQENMAEKCNCSRATYLKWEHGKTRIDLSDLLKLCNIFKCDLGYLLCEYDTKYRRTADIQAETGLSEKAITVLMSQKSSSFFMEVLSSLLEQEGTYQWFFDIFRTAAELHTCRCLEEQRKQETPKLKSPKVTTISELTLIRRPLPDLQHAELQESKHHNEVVKSIVDDLCNNSSQIHQYGEATAKKDIESEKNEFGVK